MDEARTEEESTSVWKTVRAFCRANLGIFLTPAGATIAAISFFLPWIRMSCLGTRSYSGIQMGGLFWIVFVAAVIMLASFIVVFRLKRFPLMRYAAPVCTAIAAVAVIYTCLTMPSGKRILLVKIGADDVNLRLFIGAYSTILGFVMAVIGSQILPRPQVKSPEVDTPEPQIKEIISLPE